MVFEQTHKPVEAGRVTQLAVRLSRGVVVVLLIGVATACAADRPAPPSQILPPPQTTSVTAASYMTDGVRYFMVGDWAQAAQAFQRAVEAQPDLAEAHYNLAVSLDHSGQAAEAKKHYVLAANLAPGNKVMWDAPPFRDAVKQKPLLRNPPLLKNNPGVTF